MALSAKLQLRQSQSQSLVMTPQLMQSIKLLQLSHLELEQFVDQEIERNPLLERAGAEALDSADSDQQPNAAVNDDGGTSETDGSELDPTIAHEAPDAPADAFFPDDPGPVEAVPPGLAAQQRSLREAGSGGPLGEAFDPGQAMAAPVTLADHIGEQIGLAFPGPADGIVAHELVGYLDENGYISADLCALADRLGTDRAHVETVLAACQTFDPPGIFARDLSECLALQLKAKDRFDPAMAAMINHLDLLAQRDFRTLRRLCGVVEEDLIDMLGEIRALDPKPGTAFASGMTDAIIPDVVVTSAPNGGWVVELNADALPRVLVDRDYATRVSALSRTPEEREFVSTCLQDATWLTRSLDQRANTILKVASEIVRQQDAFLIHGVAQLRPLNLRTVADAISMHESTVSRVTVSKYMQTPRGMFEMRYFFTAAIASAEGGEAHSAEAVRHRIRQLIDLEEAAKVLSDDAIVDILNEDGIDIARRTVAKYREAMNIASSVQRRREKKARARAAEPLVN